MKLGTESGLETKFGSYCKNEPKKSTMNTLQLLCLEPFKLNTVCFLAWLSDG